MPKRRELEIKQMPGFITKMDEAEGVGIVEAIVSVTGIVDDGNDVIQHGAYAKTISERGRKIRVLNSHNMWSISDVLGVVLELREIGRDEMPAEILERYPEADGGLWTKTQYVLDTQAGREAYALIKSGAVDEYSIGYEAMQFEYQKRGEGEPPVRVIKEIKLWEYSPVVWGMNPATMTTGVKSLDAEALRPLAEAGLAALESGDDEAIRAAAIALIEAAGVSVDNINMVDDESENESNGETDTSGAEPDDKSTHSDGAPADDELSLERKRLQALIEIGLEMEAQS